MYKKCRYGDNHFRCYGDSVDIWQLMNGDLRRILVVLNGDLRYATYKR